MSTMTTDAQLVAGHLAGDRAALAAIYDRYAGTLYDTAAAMTGSRDDAADVVQDVFVIAAERLGQLREPDRLRPWLFAILRNEVYRRTRTKHRTVATDFTAAGADVHLPSDPAPESAGAEYEELAALVRAAAAGLDERDQLVLEYSVRHELDGDDLAAALGVSPQQCYGLVHRMRQRAERSLGAYCVARTGRKDCDELAAILRDWDGEFSVLIRKRVARHVDQCDTCERSRRKVAPLTLFGAAPAFALPLDLRDRVLSATRHTQPDPGYGFERPGGFPSTLRAARRFGWLPALAATFLLLGVLGAIVAIAVADPVSDTLQVEPLEATAATTDATVSDTLPTTTVSDTVTTVSDTVQPGPTTTAAPGAVVATPPTTAPSPTAPSPTAPPTTAAPPPPPPTPPAVAPPPTTTAPPAPGALAVSAGGIDFGATRDQLVLTLSNTGGQPVDWSAALGPAGLRAASAGYSVEPASGRLEASASVGVTIRFDRAAAAEGPQPPTKLTFSGPGTSAAVSVNAHVGRVPVVRVTRPGATTCATQPLTFAATIIDESPITAVAEATHRASGTTRRVGLTSGGGAWGGAVPVAPSQVGAWDWVVTATDGFGNASTARGTTDVQTFHACS
jgi:RNA polymerase sigma factor (sigma-70 family)